MKRVAIVGAARTPIGKLGGALATLSAVELGTIAIQAALQRAQVAVKQFKRAKARIRRGKRPCTPGYLNPSRQ